MDLSRYVDQLQHQLTTAAAASGDEARELAVRLTAPLDAATRLVLLDALSDAAGEISAELAPGSVDVRLRGGSPEFVVAPPAGAAGPGRADGSEPGRPGEAGEAGEPPPADPSARPEDAPATTRTTLRLPDHLKAQAEVAAARDGVSVNTWLVRAVAAALERPSGPPSAGSAAQAGTARRGAGRVTGWVR
ncbi:toxin-antitoxin system HicB family antitoxin [Isoptericola sp. BMS4]|uniref:toxin-antitoxin system HicB family antitoxin n=1 Tax=Isoptericola sp. BMS4 TaxID=2527875 RepID=UPI0014213B0F|nr:toxin-antitoxin system HicB family antitoxin [Isoptericola sp. BMS4]